ncbi:MAG TPA: APC family permease [Actinomycetota bacterium]|nr:APC family permease [Actinomycetota bacterium]
MSKAPVAMKRLLLGRPMASGELGHTLLPKVFALPVFASDALSSMSYASQEVLIVLVAAGTGALALGVPISLAVSFLLAVVIISYRQIVRAYPGGGGAYAVAYENLGTYSGLVVAGALLLDYVLTVAVSITAGADAIVSAASGLHEHKLSITIGLIGLVTFANLRGAKESARIFAIPTYGFVLSIFALVITGLVRCLDGCPQAESASLHPESHSLLTAFLVLKAFAAGTTALTGVEAIAEGVPVFRYPQSKNAATTLSILGVLSISMFIGVAWLADKTNVVYIHELEGQRTVIAQIANAVFGGGPMFYLVQIMTVLILILAANTAYTGFPVLASILARDRFLPRQLLNRGDRLVFSNGVLILAVFAVLLVYAFNADLNRLIQLYLVGVFISFTLAQFGTVVRWRRTREPGWQRSAAINAFGGLVTGVVLAVVVLTKFKTGAWIVLTAMPFLIFMMRSINRHYVSVLEELSAAERRPVDRRPGHQHMVVFVQKVDAASARAVGIVRSIRPNSLSAITVDPTLQSAWRRLAPDIPIEALPGGGSTADRIRGYLRTRRQDLEEDDFLTLVIPEILHRKGLIEIATRSHLHRLKAGLLREPGVQVMDVPLLRDDIDHTVDEAREPARNYVFVLVSSVQNATLQAIEYAETMRPTDLRAVSFGLDASETEQLGDLWLEARIPHPLEMEAAPFRDIGEAVVNYVNQFRPDGVERMVTIVLPEFVVKKAHHQILHGQTALLVKRRVLFEKGVVTVSVPYHLEH